MYNPIKIYAIYNQLIKDIEQLQASIKYHKQRKVKPSNAKEIAEITVTLNEARERIKIAETALLEAKNNGCSEKEILDKTEAVNDALYTMSKLCHSHSFLGDSLANDMKKLESLEVKKEKIEIVFVGLGVVALGGVATAAFFAPQIVAGATVAFLAAKPYLIALGAMVWAGLVKLGTTIAAHKVAASVIATTTATAAVLTPTLYFKKSRECVGKALVGALETYGKAWSPEPGIYPTM